MDDLSYDFGRMPNRSQKFLNHITVRVCVCMCEWVWYSHRRFDSPVPLVSHSTPSQSLCDCFSVRHSVCIHVSGRMAQTAHRFHRNQNLCSKCTHRPWWPSSYQKRFSWAPANGCKHPTIARYELWSIVSHMSRFGFFFRCFYSRHRCASYKASLGKWTTGFLIENVV